MGGRGEEIQGKKRNSGGGREIPGCPPPPPLCINPEVLGIARIVEVICFKFIRCVGPLWNLSS